MPLLGHGEDKYITGTRLQSSAGQEWGSLLAETWQHKQGRLRDLKPRETEVAIVLKGQAKVRRCGDGKTQLCNASAGTVWVCPAGIEESKIRLYGDLDQVLHIYIPGAPLAETALCDFNIDPRTVSLRYAGGFKDEFIRQIGLIILEEMKAANTVSALRVETLQVGLAAHLLSKYSSLQPDRATQPPVAGALDHRRLARVIEYIDANSGQNLRLRELSAIACLSPYHFSRAFKISTGKAPHRFLIENRLNKSKELLNSDNRSLSDIALEVGFSSQSHFNRAFKEITGMTPGAYRQMSCPS